jgi:hypothetical protein
MSGIPAVVAMQYPIDPIAAVMFFQEFYNRLASEDPIDVAVQKARFRTQANLKAYRLLGTPIFYMQSMEGALIPPLGLDQAPRTAEVGVSAGWTGMAPTPASLRERLVQDVSTEDGATDEEKRWVLAFLDREWTDDQTRLEQAIRRRFSENDPPGQLAIYIRMLSTLKSEGQRALT